MRNGAKTDQLKQFLKVLEVGEPGTRTALQENYRKLVGLVVIVRADKFWDRHKTAVEKGRYSFEVQALPVEQLPKLVAKTDLLPSFGGSL